VADAGAAVVVADSAVGARRLRPLDTGNVRIGEYEQEINKKYLPESLEQAILSVYEEHKIPLDTRQVKSLMSQYLFDPVIDANQKIAAMKIPVTTINRMYPGANPM